MWPIFKLFFCKIRIQNIPFNHKYCGISRQNMRLCVAVCVAQLNNKQLALNIPSYKTFELCSAPAALIEIWKFTIHPLRPATLMRQRAFGWRVQNQYCPLHQPIHGPQLESMKSSFNAYSPHRSPQRRLSQVVMVNIMLNFVSLFFIFLLQNCFASKIMLIFFIANKNYTHERKIMLFWLNAE